MKNLCVNLIPTIRKYDDFAENVAILVENLRTFTYLLVLDSNNLATALIWCHPTPTVPANPTSQNMLLKTKFARQLQPANKLSRAKSAYQVLKKEIEMQKNLLFGVKFECIPRI